MAYVASRCPCGHKACNAWHVDGVAAVQGVYFTERQARIVAAVLTKLDKNPDARVLAIQVDRKSPRCRVTLAQ